MATTLVPRRPPPPPDVAGPGAGPRSGAGTRRALRDNEAGFTLIELLVVVIILGLLAALVGPRLLGRVGQSKQAAARVQIELLGTALDQFKLDAGRYPTTQDGLRALQANPGNLPNWEGPYLKKDVPKDPWANAYQYKSPGDHGEYDLWSYGSDNAPGGEGEAADVASWGAEGRSG
jgi:general secretion pathway protein G